MDRNGFYITGWAPPFYALDPAGRRLEMRERHTAGFILPLCGRIRFSVGDTVLIADREHPLFLPEGLTYLNECIEDARSYVFNFRTSYPLEAAVLAPVPEQAVRAYAEEMSRCAAADSLQSGAQALAALYSLAGELFAPVRPLSAAQETVRRAREYMMLHYASPDLHTAEIASACCVSEIWLRKLLRRECGTAPHRMLTEIRMEKAALLLRENRPVGETAAAVGYSDIYSFSRAYRRHFGEPPSCSR